MKPISMTLCPAAVPSDFVGHSVLIATDNETQAKIDRMEPGLCIGVDVYIPTEPRSIEQNALYWAACTLVAENMEDEIWSTKERVDYNCKIICGHVKDRYRIKTKDGQEFDVVIPDSISFAKCDHLSACGYFTKAFEVMAKKMQITPDELIHETKAKMKGAA